MTTSTHERLITAAVRRFYRDGFRNVGIDQILSDVNISKTAFYKHFESKEDLMLEALEMQSRWLQQTFRDLVCERGGPSPIARLHAIFDVVEMIIESDDYQGCIFVNVSMEFPLLHDPAHQLAAENKAAIEDFIYSIAEEAGALEPRQLAQELALVIEGGYVTRQVTGNTCTIDIARRIAQVLIEERCPQSGP